MAVYRLAVIIKGSSNDDDFLVIRQTPPEFPEEEYKNYVDTDLWDLPSAPLKPLDEESTSPLVIDRADTFSEKLNLRMLDVDSALSEVVSQVGLRRSIGGNWMLWKYAEEAEFGPGALVHTVFILGKLTSEEEHLRELCKWMSIQSCLKLLLEVKPSHDRIGPLVVMGLIADLAQSRKWKVPHTLRCKEYPPGVTVLPMASRTLEPFRTTNLVIIAPDNVTNSHGDSGLFAYGDALIVDPGCHSGCNAELTEIVAALPKKLVVFITHHHYDHVDGLSIVQKCNPHATILAHENTMHRIGKEHWSLGYTPISGGEHICIAGQRLDVIFAPGHTDGHMALLHVSTHSLIVGDHCVGEGSAALDYRSGGNMKDYFQTTYNFLELSPNAIIPMHGRINLWPKYMLCGYLRNRKDRESSILKAIESGAETLFDIISKAYAGLETRLWIPASSNVRLHVDHLAHQNKLPKGFSLEKIRINDDTFIAKMVADGEEP